MSGISVDAGADELISLLLFQLTVAEDPSETQSLHGQELDQDREEKHESAEQRVW